MRFARSAVVSLVVALAAIVALFVATYVLATQWLYDTIRSLLRREARLVRKVQVVDGRTWTYLEGGPADADPVVMLHGFGGDKDNWPIYARHLTRDFRVIAPDLPGFGDSAREPGADYRSAAQAERLVGFLDALRIERCHLAGHSMGGLIALRFAIDLPDRLATLTLFNNAGVAGVSQSDLQHSIAAGENALAINTVDDVNRLLAFTMHNAPRVPRRFCEIVHAEVAEHSELLDEIFWQVAREATDGVLNDRIDEVGAPTLVVWGRHDRLIDVSCVDVLVDRIRGARAVVFDDVAHVPIVEAPRRTSAAHLAFLAPHATVTPAGSGTCGCC